MVSHPLDVSMMCYLIRPYWPLYPVPVRWNRALQSCFLQCTPHSEPPCSLLILRGTTPAYKGLGFLRTLWNNFGILDTRCPCRAHTNDIAHTSSELLETEIQNRYFSRYLLIPEAGAISGRYPTPSYSVQKATVQQ